MINEETYCVVSDIRLIVDYVREVHKVDIRTLTLDQIAKEGILKENGNLEFQGKDIAVAYFRTGYVP